MNNIFLKCSGRQKIFVVGDIHGDLGVLLVALQVCAGVIDDKLCWKKGNSSWVVIMGDMMDRLRFGTGASPELEHEELLIQIYLNKLHSQAVKYGGRVVKIIGNHELMNITGDTTYVSELGLKSRRTFPLARGSDFARELCTPNAYSILQAGSWLFLHAGIGGLTPKNISLLPKLNGATRRLFNQTGPVDAKVMNFLLDEKGVAWDRTFSNGTVDDASILEKQFKLVSSVTKRKIKRMAVGHTPQELNPSPAYEFQLSNSPASPLHAGGPRRNNTLTAIFTRYLEQGKSFLPKSYREHSDWMERLPSSEDPAEFADHLTREPLVLQRGDKGICTSCDTLAWCVDVGMSRGFGCEIPAHRAPQVLEVRGNGDVVGVHRLKPNVWTAEDRARHPLPPWMTLWHLNSMMFYA